MSLRRWARRTANSTLRAAFLARHQGRVTIGAHCEIPFRSFQAHVQSLTIGDYVRFGYRLRLYGGTFIFGDHFYCGHDVCVSGFPERFEAGKFSSVGSEVWFILGRGAHRLESLANFPFGHTPPFHGAGWRNGSARGEDEPGTFCVLGHDVWIGGRSIILPNVTIGHGAIVAAGSVVTRNVPPYAIVGGNPAQVISFRFKSSLIKELLELRWWDWPMERISKHAALFTKNLMTRASISGLQVADSQVRSPAGRSPASHRGPGSARGERPRLGGGVEGEG